MMTAVGEAHAVKRFLGRATSFGRRNAGVNKGKFDIFQRGCPRQKGRLLKYESDVAAPDGRASALAQLCNFSTAERVSAGIGPIQ